MRRIGVVCAIVLSSLACRAPESSGPPDDGPPPSGPDTSDTEPGTPEPASPTPIGADDPDLVAWLASDAGQSLAERVDASAGQRLVMAEPDLRLMILPLADDGASEDALVFYADPSAGFETFIRRSEVEGEGEARSGSVSLRDLDGRIVIAVDVDAGAEQCRSDFVDLTTPASKPRSTSGAGSPECFWNCIGSETTLGDAAQAMCDECLGSPDPKSCGACAALIGVKGALCLGGCGFPGTGGVGMGGVGGGCAGAGFTLFPSLCH